MNRKFYALLVGINEYTAPGVANLNGCRDDIENLEYYLSGELEHLDVGPDAIKILLDGEATYQNVIDNFRQHLVAQAGPDDVVLFHYSGHGSRQPSAPEFKEFFPDGMDETLVCYDSRPDGNDLCDKEMAVLVSEAAATGAHVVISLDSCHSGSGTRSTETTELTLRQTSDKKDTRPIDSYIDGYYVKNGAQTIPAGKHLLMASCNRYQTAADGSGGGLYSSGLVKVLEDHGNQVSYADLFIKTRNKVTNMALAKNHAQSPQFEAYDHFNAFGRFLDGSPVTNRDRYTITFDADSGSWTMGFGAINGLPADPEKTVEVAIYQNRGDSGEPAAFAKTTWVGAQNSGLDLDHANKEDTLFAEIISLPVPPFLVLLDGDQAGKDLIQKTLDESHKGMGVELVPEKGNAAYGISCENDQLLLKRLSDGQLITGAKPFNDNAANYVLKTLDKVVKWERSIGLNNNRPKLNPDDVEFSLYLQKDGNEVLCEGPEVELIYEGQEIRAKVKAQNNTPQKVHYIFLYYSEHYGIFPLNNDPLEEGLDAVTLWGSDPDDYLYLEEGDNQSTERFRLLITTEKADDFLQEQEEIEHFGEILDDPSFRAIGNLKKKEKVKNDWFMKSLTITVKRG